MIFSNIQFRHIISHLTMSLLQQIGLLITKDLRLEWRQRYALSGILLYVVSTVMVVYLSLSNPQPAMWTAVLWIILLFASVNAVAKSFMQESTSRQLYYYTIASPQAIIVAKMLYNVLLLLLLASIGMLVYSTLLGNPVENIPLFLGIVAMGACSFALCFTLIAGIAAKAGKSAVLMPILSFPIIIPTLGLLVRTSKVAVLGIDDIDLNKDLGILAALNLMQLTLSYILFPFLWKD